jgi:hypothetical protein
LRVSCGTFGDETSVAGSNASFDAVSFKVTAPLDGPKAEQEMHKFLDELDLNVVNVAE